jgi:hypothetical protein
MIHSQVEELVTEFALMVYAAQNMDSAVRVSSIAPMVKLLTTWKKQMVR